MSDWLFAAFAGSAVWGVIGCEGEPQAAVGRLGSPVGEWHQAPELELTTSRGAGVALSATPGAADAFSLGRVSGTHAAGGESLTLDVPAVAVAHPSLAKLDSARILAAWFGPDRAIVLSAVRPRNSHADKDVVSVAVAGIDPFAADQATGAEREPLQIFDPRLSTTYDGQGIPLRAGVELWLGADEDSDQRPLRLSAESTGDRLTGEIGGLRLDAYAQRCHSRGEDGAGIYTLLRPR